MSSQLPFNTEAMLALAPSEYGVGFKVYMMADRMHPCDPGKHSENKQSGSKFWEAIASRALSDGSERIGYLCRNVSLWLPGYNTGYVQ